MAKEKMKNTKETRIIPSIVFAMLKSPGHICFKLRQTLVEHKKQNKEKSNDRNSDGYRYKNKKTDYYFYPFR